MDCALQACGYLSGQDFDHKPYQVFADGLDFSGKPYNWCSQQAALAGLSLAPLAAPRFYVACAFRRAAGGPWCAKGAANCAHISPYTTWGYAVDNKGDAYEIGAPQAAPLPAS